MARYRFLAAPARQRAIEEPLADWATPTPKQRAESCPLWPARQRGSRVHGLVFEPDAVYVARVGAVRQTAEVGRHRLARYPAVERERLALAQRHVEAEAPEGGQPIEAGERDAALDGGELEGQRRQRSGQAGQDGVLEALHVDLGEGRRAVLRHQGIESCAWHRNLDVPNLPFPAAGAVGGGDAPFALQLELQATQPLLLQGDGGYSRKGPLPQRASHYYSAPHLRVRATLERSGKAASLQGRAWLDHEWSDEYLPPGAAGWDWIGINLNDGGALMAFRLRRADGSALWAGGTHRAADGRVRTFAPDELRFTAQRWWTSVATQSRYPVQWLVESPVGRFVVRALMDAQELDGRTSNGAVYWEGLSDLFDDGGRAIGRGYLEMTGYGKPLSM